MEKVLASSNLRPISEQQLIHSILCVEDLETGKHVRPPAIACNTLWAYLCLICSDASRGRLANWITNGSQRGRLVQLFSALWVVLRPTFHRKQTGINFSSEVFSCTQNAHRTICKFSLSVCPMPDS